MLEKSIEKIETVYKVTALVSQDKKSDMRKLFSSLQKFVYDNKDHYDLGYIDSLREDLQSLINFVDSIK